MARWRRPDDRSALRWLSSTRIRAPRTARKFFWPAVRGGVFRRVPSLLRPGATGPWSEFGQSLPNTVISDIQLYNNDRLVAATFGHGAWVLPNVGASIRVDTLIQVVGDDNANLLTMTPDPNNRTTSLSPMGWAIR